MAVRACSFSLTYGIISPLFKELKKMRLPMTSSWIVRSALLSLLVKGAFASLISPLKLRVMFLTRSMYVIGFLHLVLLGL